MHLAWHADVVDGELLAGDDADDARWFDLDELPWDQLASRSSHAALRDLLTRIAG